MLFSEHDVTKFESSSVSVFIDADSMLYYTALTKDVDGRLDIALELFREMVKSIRLACNSDGFFYFFFSCNRKDNFRTLIEPTYKATRKAEKPKIIDELRKTLVEKYGNIYECVGCEADDAVCFMKTKQPNGIVCSPDKDVLQQIAGRHYNYRTNTIVETSAESAYRFKLYQMLAGDNCDNIKGLKGVGPVAAERMLDAMRNVNTSMLRYYRSAGLGYRDMRKTLRLVSVDLIKDAELKNQKFLPKVFSLGNI